MAYFPKITPFYEPSSDPQRFGETDGRLQLSRNENTLHERGGLNR